MKTAFDPRHIRRQKIVQALFSWSFQSRVEEEDENLIKDSFTKIVGKCPQLDSIVESAAPERPISQIAKVDLSILRLAVFELLEEDAPIKVIVDEAVELAKEFGGETSGSFINGVLGTVIKSLEEKKEKKDESNNA